MKLIRLPLLLMSAALGPPWLLAQPMEPPVAPAPASNDPWLSVSQPGTYSGISGPGAPVQGSGLGGWRSGRDGVRYKGPNPKPGWQLDWDAKQSSSDEVINLGLLPPIKPLWELHLRDTIICLGGDGNYYMTGSSGDNIWDKNDGIELWRSTDLKKWDYLGLVWSLTKDATWEKSASYVWAPEIHYLKGKKTYCLTLCVGGKVTGTGMLISTSGKPAGPYIHPFQPDQRATGGIDATIFEDDDGKLYYTSGHGSTIFQLKDDLSGFTDQGHNISLDAESRAAARAIGVTSGVGGEGPSIFKRNGKYYLGGAVFIGGVNRQTGKNGRYSSCVAIADNIYGPYSLYQEAVPCGAGGNYFQDKEGNWYCTYFGNDEASPFREKPGIVRIDFQPNGQIKIADEQPAFILRDGTPANWRIALKKPSPPQAIPVPVTTPTPDSSISGPGAVFSLDGPVYQQRSRPDASAVKTGLIPPLKPLLDLHIRDTIIRLGGDGNYYMTGSTGADIWNKDAAGIELWRSPDLKKWEYLGVVWNLARDGTWEKEHVSGKYAHTIWAPEIVYIKRLKNYFLTYSLPPGDRGILKSTTGKAEGPYVNALANDSKLAGEIDLSLFEDDDGTIYATWGPALIAKMKDDLSGFAEEPHNPELLNPDLDPSHHATTSVRRGFKDIGHEGPSLFKKDGKYYLTAADTYLGRYSSMAAVADNVYGPYNFRHEAVPGGGGGDYFKDNDGNWWCTYFGNDSQSPFREMPALVKVEFDEAGIIHVAKKQPYFVLLPEPAKSTDIPSVTSPFAQ